MATARVAGAALRALAALFLVVTGCSESGTMSPPQGTAGTNATPPAAGSCSPGQNVACNTVTCPGGAAPSAVCSPAGTPGTCTCPATGGAGTAAPTAGSGTPAAGSGGTPMAGNGGTAGAAGSGTAGGPAAGAPAAGGPAPMAGGNAWPQMGYDANNNYFNPNETKLSVATAPMLAEKWRFSVAGFPPGTPIIAEGKVFVMSTGGTYAINLADGTMVWARMDIAGTASLAYENGFIYAHGYMGPNIFKLKASDGTTVWGPSRTNDNATCDGTSSPIVAGGMVVVGHSCGAIEIGGGDVTTARGGVEAFDTESGMRKWVYFTVPETGEDGAMVWSSVGIDPESQTVYAATGNNYSQLGPNSDAIHAIDLASGMRKWKTQVRDNDVWSLLVAPTGPDTDFGANPILATIGGKKIVANGDKGSFFHMFDATTGQVLWSRAGISSSSNQANGGILMNGAYDGKNFYAVANQPPGQAVLRAMDPNNMGADVWQAKTYNKLTWGAPSLANGVLVVPNDDDLYVYDAASGEQLAMFNTGGTIAAGAAAIADGHVVVGSGLEYALDPTVKRNNQIVCYGLP